MCNEKYFVRPSDKLFTDSQSGQYIGQYRTYSHYNYLRPGLVARVKRSRFEVALKLAKLWFGTCSALDVGCADGIFLPSLSRHFTSVVGIEPNEEYIGVAQKLVDAAGLSNVRLVHNSRLTFAEMARSLPPADYGVAFILETMEHVGTPGPDMYPSKTEFLDGVFSLLRPDGHIIISVPKMVGLGFLGKYLLQMALRMPTETMSFSNLTKSAFLYNTDALEPGWAGGHNGFNHLKLLRHLRDRYVVERRLGTAVTAYFVIRQR